MKFLIMGDFHGEVPQTLKKYIEKNNVDLLVCNGDFFPFSYRDIWFKHCYRSDKELWEVLGKKKYKSLVEKDLRSGEKVLKNLNKLQIPVYTVIGNLDYTNTNDSLDIKKSKDDWKWANQDFFSPMIKKYENIKRFDYKSLKFRDLVFIGGFGHTFPGVVRSKAYKKHRKILENLFKKFKKENSERKVIFITHNMPHNTKLDKIGMKAHEAVRGKHYGSKLIRRIIDKYQPVLQAGGHIHEAFGISKLGKTTIINPGAAHEHKAALVEVKEKKGKYIYKTKIIKIK